MPSRVELRQGVYHDSVVLMQAGAHVRAIDSIDECLVAMATPLNLALLKDLGFGSGEAGSAAASDLVVAIRAGSREAIDHGVQALDDFLDSRATLAPAGADVEAHRSLRAAVRAANANLAMISVPGPHAAAEAADALREGANVLLFSDGVSIDEERRLKTLAAGRGLIVMGPDCGTARLGGIGLGFCNALGAGEIGIVAASGTGAQHLSCLLEARGMGVGTIIGVGGRDTSDDIGAVSTLQALRMLDADPGTAHIVLVSKPPGESCARRIDEAIRSLGTAVTVGLLGRPDIDLTRLARQVAEARNLPFDSPRVELSGSGHPCRRLVGLFSGGTLAAEAKQIVGGVVGAVDDIDSFATPSPATIAGHDGHLIVDLGDDRMTVGRPHPMIDATTRRAIIEDLARRPASRLLFIDIVLGYGADPDPAAALAASLAAFLGSHAEARVVATLVGTSGDPQGYERQWRTLADLGCDVYESNAEAAAAVARSVRPGAGADGG